MNAQSPYVSRERALVLSIADWVLPPRIFRLLTTYRPSAIRFWLTHHGMLAANRVIRDRHRGQRCFVLCNGPSVNRQDLLPLRDEIVFSVSNGYHLARFSDIRPRYHCVPQLTYGNLTREAAIRWFSEMHDSIHDAELFLSSQEYDLVRGNGLFAGRTVRYLCLGRNHFPRQTHWVPNLTGILPRVQTVPILAIMIALYMGFKEIYLLGVEHDWFVTKRYDYSFPREKTGWRDFSVNADGTVSTTLLDELPIVRRVWEQHWSMRRCAEALGARIYNATNGGMLDVHPRISLEHVLAARPVV